MSEEVYMADAPSTMRFGSTAKILANCKFSVLQNVRVPRWTEGQAAYSV